MTDTAVNPSDLRPSVWASAPRVYLISLAVSVVLAASGAAHDWQHAVEFTLDSMFGATAGLATARWIVPAGWYNRRLWSAAILIGLVVSFPITAVVTLSAVAFHDAPFSLGLVAGILPSVLATTLTMTALAMFVRVRTTQTHAAPEGAPPAKFLARLPAKLAGGDLYAIEAEDHYLRLHTSLGQDLILMRLGDAIDELEGVEGAQTHRSWWVAKGAVAEVEKLDGRAVLTLKDGAEVPVSRGFAKTLRAAGWF